MLSDSLAASASVSIRNQVFPPGASQTYFMHPPTFHTTPSREPSAARAALSAEDNMPTRRSRDSSDHYSSIFSIRCPAVTFFWGGPEGDIRPGLNVLRPGGVGPFPPQRDQCGHDRW